MKHWITWMLCLIMAVSLLPAALAEETEEPTETSETVAMTEELGEAAVNNENADDTLVVFGDGALAPTGFDTPEDETGRGSDLSMKAETSGEPMTFEYKQFTAVLEDSVLTLSGEGDTGWMSNGNQVPWYSVRNQIREVVIEEGVRSINKLFCNCTNLKKVTFPESLVSLPENISKAEIR